MFLLAKVAVPLVQSSIPDASRGFEQAAQSWRLTKSAACSSLLARWARRSVPAPSWLPLFSLPCRALSPCLVLAALWSVGCGPPPGSQGRGFPPPIFCKAGSVLAAFCPRGRALWAVLAAALLPRVQCFLIFPVNPGVGVGADLGDSCL